ncbi:MAG TPA: pinensin family lanthipeptide [Longimicrobium sp.]|jgi:hypothetical protein|uniref:pinensin family lanthipeptide n=1 Tax=Longimicrobium sp. TaxID=2029185 RepID=UPI002EDB476C
MRKLKLEALQVESFETTSGAPRMRGTIQGNADATGTGTGTGVSVCAVCEPWSNDRHCGPDTYNVHDCGETMYFDCTFGCTRNTCDPHVNSCGQYCWIEDTAQCVVEK